MMLPSIAASAERAFLDDVVGAARVHEHQLAHLGGLRPERIELRQRQVFAVDMSAQRDAARAEPRDGILQHLGGQIRETAAAPTPSRRSGPGALFTHLRQPFVLRVADGAREPLVLDLVPPEAVDAQRLDVDALLVHERDALVEPGLPPACFSNGVPLTTSPSGMSQCACTSTTRTRASRDRDLPARLGAAPHRPTVADHV